MIQGPETVLKIGGSLSLGQDLVALCREISRLGKKYRLLVAPGGGEFADLVREVYHRYGLGETTAHRMAILAMDQYGCLLGDLIQGSRLTADLLSARQAFEEGRAAVLLPTSLLIQADPLPHSWQVTSDSISAWVAGLACASRLVLLKDVDGLYREDPLKNEAAELLSEIGAEALAGRQGGVDETLGTILASLDLETWVINGQRPERLVELLETGTTIGTRITGRFGNGPVSQSRAWAA